MAITTRKNLSVKAIQSAMAKAKKWDARAKLEWLIACNTNSERGEVFDQWKLNELYGRDDYDAPQGATKTCHTISHKGEEFQYIVIKRHQTGGYCPELRNAKATGNQLIDEINAWNEFAETETADLLCPILKYFTSKSDKVDATSETMQRNVVIIAQKAVKIGSAEYVCKKAEEMNARHGYKGERAYSRLAKLQALSDSKNWRDAMRNPGNSGVIFDYHKGCYKAVFIDYAL